MDDLPLVSVLLLKYFFKSVNCTYAQKPLRQSCVKSHQQDLTQKKLRHKLPLNKGRLKLRCDERFTHAFTACCCVFKELMLVGSNQGNYFENATACSKRTLKTTVATELKSSKKV